MSVEADFVAMIAGFGGVLMTLASASIDAEVLRDSLMVAALSGIIPSVYVVVGTAIRGWHIPPGGVTKRLARPELAGAVTAAGGALIAVGVGIARHTDMNRDGQLDSWLGFLGELSTFFAIYLSVGIWIWLLGIQYM